MKGKLSFFKDDPFIRNFGPANFNIETLMQESPTTMLVHSSYKFADQQRKMLLDQKYLTHDLTLATELSFQELLGRAATESEGDFFHRVLQPYHDELSTVSCLLSSLLSLCPGSRRKSVYCANSDISNIFSSDSEAALTANYIMRVQRMPGPEAHFYFSQIESQRDIKQQLCSLSLSSKHLQEGVILQNQSFQELSNSNNKVVASSYLRTCSNSHYDSIKDMLTCELDGRLLSMQHPFRCAEDISINAEKQLVC